MNNDFVFGLIISILIIAIAMLCFLVRKLKVEIKKLRDYIYGFIDSAGRGDN